MITGNLVYQSSTTTGTGNLTVAAITGFRNFSDEFSTGSSNTFFYCIRHTTANEFEVGTGYMSDATTLVRSSVIESSNANALVNFSAGTKDVVSDIPAGVQNTRIDVIQGQVFS